MKKNTIVFDFDGVIHSYISGWKGYDVIPDPPVNGIKEVINELRKDYKVVVVSARAKTPIGRLAIKEYLREHNIVVDDISDTKPPAFIYIDDRAICFKGNSNELLEQIRNFKPWQDKIGDNNGKQE